jgi:hypothetical protein
MERGNLCKEKGCSRCCRDMLMELSANEVQDLRNRGAVLEEADPWNLWDCRVVLYKLIGECPNLINGECAVYEQAGRPKECEKYVYEGPKCRRLRG